MILPKEIENLLDLDSQEKDEKIPRNIGVYDETLKWGNNKYASLCKNKENAVTFFFIQGENIYRSFIIITNETRQRYDDPQSLANISDYDSNFPINVIESLKNDGFFIVKTY